MRKIFIGHRGTGKSALVKRHAEIYPQVPHFDLDQLIEENTERTVTELFSEQGEGAFRQLEIEQLRSLVTSNESYVVAVGGGFPVSKLGELAPQAVICHVSRDTDADGRIFLNRPRLDPHLTALEESQRRYRVREPLFRAVAHQRLHLPEGFDDHCKSETAKELERKILRGQYKIQDAFYTISRPEAEFLLKNSDLCEDFLSHTQIELRTDLLNQEQILFILQHRPDCLLSIRTDGFIEVGGNVLVDEDVSFYTGRGQIVSSHAADIKTGISELSAFAGGEKQLKLCPLVNNFNELIIGYHWQTEDPTRRNFLPRSQDGRWLWFRLLAKYHQRINFIRGVEFTADQPSPFQWLVMPPSRPQKWAAVLGEPVHFSRSPLEHLDFFSQRDTFFARVQIGPAELKENLNFLVQCGLSYAAVTAPLKEMAFSLVAEKQSASEAVNTLFITDRHRVSKNTDTEGFKSLVSAIRPADRVAVWGGGGTLGIMRSVLPEAHYFSARTGTLRDPGLSVLPEYDYLIWAAPRASQTSWLKLKQFRFKNLIDLNYTGSSAGLEFAAENKISYTSGLKMFQVQASAQQSFWSSCERQ